MVPEIIHLAFWEPIQQSVSHIDWTWYDQTGTSGTQLDLTNLEDVPQDQLALPQRPTDSGCAVDNVSINITVPLENLEGKPEDSYSDTIDSNGVCRLSTRVSVEA